MSNLQAQAEQTDQTTVADPLDQVNIPNGADELQAYQAELDALERGEFQEEPVTEETLSGDGLTPTGEPTTETEPEPEASTTEETEEAEAEGKLQMRPRLKDPLDVAVASLAKAKGITLIEAAKIIDGNAPRQESQATQENGTQGPTVDSVTEEIKSLQAAKKQAFADLEFEKAAEFDEKIDGLREQRETLRIEEATAKARIEREAQEDFDKRFAASESQATKLYPGIDNPESAHYKRVMELDAEMKQLGDPLYHSPDKPMILAKAAAAELGIRMTNPNAAPVSQTSKVKTAPIQPAPGNRSTTVATAPAAKLDQVIDGIGSEGDYENLVARLSGKA